MASMTTVAQSRRLDSRLNVLSAQRHLVANCLDQLIPSGSAVALIDFPEHANVGDSAIYLGEAAYLKRRGCRVQYISDWQTHDTSTLRRALAEGIILIHGGGNFGDLYPHHQKLRESILRDLPDRRVIQLSQSIHFDRQEAREESRRVVATHPDFHLVVRDHASLEQARRDYDTPVHLCPDMALMLDPTNMPRYPAQHPAVVLSRTDDEKIGVSANAPANTWQAPVFDWLEESPPRDSWLYLWATTRMNWPSSKWPQSWLAATQRVAARRMAIQRLERGLRLIHRGQTLVTDRLHAAILGWMTGMPVFYVDNRYRKLGNVLDAWLSGQSEIQRFASLDAALSAAIASTHR
jgi:exopolysaccharide biosynthesis predicted pyruvyltransferase EpsI